MPGTPNQALTPSDADIISEAMASMLIDVHVALPGKVESYDPLTQTASIELGLKRTLPKDDGTYTTEKMPVLANVPVAFSRASGMAITLPVEPGDTGLVVFCEQSIDQWRALGSVSSPGEIGRHTLSGGVFFPGLAPTINILIPPPDSANLVFGTILPAPVGAQVHVTPAGTIHFGSGLSSEAMVLGTTFMIDYNTHTHTAPGGPTGPPLVLSTALSLKVFGE